MSLSLYPVFLVGLLGSVHCAGMCGGIVGAFSGSSAPLVRMRRAEGSLRTLAYNGGRIGSYMVAGALAGGLAGGVRTLAGAAPIQTGAYWLANLMLIALGLYLMDAWRGVALLEAAGQGAWRRLRALMEPLMKRILPLDSAGKMFALGALWGWLPCGMVYSVLVTAMLAGSASSGAAVMLAFGLGTLPMLLAMGLAGVRLRAHMQQRAVRLAAGMVVALFGLLGIARALTGSIGWFDVLCLGAV